MRDQFGSEVLVQDEFDDGHHPKINKERIPNGGVAARPTRKPTTRLSHYLDHSVFSQGHRSKKLSEKTSRVTREKRRPLVSSQLGIHAAIGFSMIFCITYIFVQTFTSFVALSKDCPC
jgi:hypothetical protein